MLTVNMLASCHFFQVSPYSHGFLVVSGRSDHVLLLPQPRIPAAKYPHLRKVQEESKCVH